MEEFKTLHSDLQLIFNWGLKYSPVDFGLSEGFRAPEKQFRYYQVGREQQADGSWKKVGETITNCNGHDIKSRHNYNPSQAVDIFISVLGKPSLSYDISHLSLVAGVLIAAAKFLYNEGKITHTLRWGGNWDKDGEILFDQKFDDLPHFEIYIP